ncbi:MAG: methyltransferase [Ignavibacteriaceae bacterium]|jgi:protein-S-isoprenylcysteine O-methyltransferase Ste14
MNLKRFSRGGFAIAVLALVTLTFRESILANGIAAILIQIIAILLMIWARVTFGGRSFHATADPTEGGLITFGPYHYIRHPIYAAIMYFLWAGIYSHFSLLNVLLGLGATFGLIIRILAEEHLVTERYPEYIEYARRTKRIIPFLL